MEYTEGMLRRLRDRLLQYKHEQRANGHRRSWEWIAAAMIEAGSAGDDEAAMDYSADAEALRRFSIGKQVPKPDRLDALRYFLIEQDYLNDSDLLEDKAPSDDLRAVYRFFGLSGQRLNELRERLRGRYTAFRHRDTGAGEISVLQIDQTDDGYLKVRESVHRTNALPNTTAPKAIDAFLKRHSLSEIRFEGWFVENASRQGIVLLKEVYTGRDDHYSVAVSEQEALDKSGPQTELLILKHAELGTGLGVGDGQADKRMVEIVESLRTALRACAWVFGRQPDSPHG